jgi:S1-C subfamily serine protease
MHAADVDESGPRTGADSDVGTSDAEESGRSGAEAWESKRLRLTVIASALILAAGIGFGVGRAMGLGDIVILSGIPKPWTCAPWLATTADPSTECAFIEDDNGTGQDNQSNILDATGGGMVHILSGGTSVGIGLVLTESGKVLTTYRPAAGAANLEAEYVLSRATFKAKVIGVDPAAGLALLQMEGGSATVPFATVAVGNSATIVQSAEASSVRSYHVPGQIYDTAVGTTGRDHTLTFDVGTLTTLDTTVSVGTTTRSGLMASAMQSAQDSAIGGPLVNLNGRVIGITVGGSGSGRDVIAYAIPINTALAIARQIDNGSS